jgi:hypothetical protein
MEIPKDYPFEIDSEWDFRDDRYQAKGFVKVEVWSQIPLFKDRDYGYDLHGYYVKYFKKDGKVYYFTNVDDSSHNFETEEELTLNGWTCQILDTDDYEVFESLLPLTP